MMHSLSYDHLKPISLEESKQCMLNVLERFGEICESLNLRYWVMYGTLIGAIRHQGFIPWDDDLDVCMPRPDYEKLIQYFIDNNNLVGSLYLDNYLFDKTCFFYITRICDNNFYLEFQSKRHASGLFIDVYPFDGMGNEEDKEFWLSKEAYIHKIQKSLDMCTQKGIWMGKNNFNRLVNMPFNIASKIRGREFYLKKIDLISKTFSWDSSQYVGIPGWGEWLRFEQRSWYEKTIRVPFENTTVVVPAEYDKVLTTIYGDYMKLPPEDKRKPWHDYKAYQILH